MAVIVDAAAAERLQIGAGTRPARVEVGGIRVTVTSMDVKRLEPVLDPRHAGDELELQTGQVINASGHLQETQRNWNIWSTIGVGTVVGFVPLLLSEAHARG